MMSSTVQRGVGIAAAASERAGAQIRVLDGAAAAFGIAAAIAIVFNTVLAWIKDAYDPLNSFMAALTGHHWITHGLADIAVFAIVGAVLMRRHVSMEGTWLVCLLAGAVIVGGGGLALWFVLV
jgi:multisubunit Na+/H+ antiporter MnhB subunit